jgi:hypothetical protein
MHELQPTHLFAFYVPKDHLNQVLDAIFETGAGKIGNYDKCCWKTEGQGQFRPLSGANPTLGQQGTIETVPEWKVELVCHESQMTDLVAAMKNSHPYEEPAYHLLPIIL